MKTKIILLGVLVILSFANYAPKVISTNADNVLGDADFVVNKVAIEWLTGTQPKLLSYMANSGSVRESLNGTSLNVGTVIGGWHAQAVAQYQDFIYVGFSNGKLSSDKVPASEKNPAEYSAKLWIYNVKTAESKIVELDKGYPHPCSIQVTGNYLTIALEAEYGISQAALGTKRSEQSMVKIYDLKKDPNCETAVSKIVQEGMNCGGAGLTYHPLQKCWYMLVDQDNVKEKVAVYKSTSSDINSWQKEPIAYYKRFGSGAGINLITATDNSIWGLWYDTSLDKMPSYSKWNVAADQVYLFKLIGADGVPVAKREVLIQNINIGSPKLKDAGDLLADRPGMRFGASLRFEGSKIEVITCQRNMDKAFNIDRFTITEGDRTQVSFINFSKARGEIKCSSLTNTTQNYSIQNMQTEAWNKVLQSPVKADINYMPIKAALTSMGKFADAIDVKSSAPLVLIYLEGDTDIKGTMLEFFATKKIDSQLPK